MNPDPFPGAAGAPVPPAPSAPAPETAPSPETPDSLPPLPAAPDAPGPSPSPPPREDGAAPEAAFRSLDPKGVKLDRTIGWIVAGGIGFVLLAVFVPLLAFSPMLLWVKWLLGLVLPALWTALALFLHRWPAVEHRHSRYRVDGQGIEIQRGVLWRSAVRVPRSRVQHLDVSQGPIERGLGLGTLILYTAGTDHARVTLSGLSHATALELRDRLLPGEGDDAV